MLEERNDIMNLNACIFIAGAYGVAGSAIKRWLLSRGYTNILTPPREELDLYDFEQVDNYFSRYRPEYVFYTAAKMGSITYRKSHPAELLLENMRMQSNVISCSHTYGVKKLLFMSSDFIYPENNDGTLRESDFLTGLPCARDFPYSLAKITGVKLCDYYREEYGDDFFTIVPCAFFGLNSSFDLERANVVASMIRRMYTAKLCEDPEFVLWGSGKPIKEFLYSDDVASACLLLMEQEKHESLYNIGSGNGGTSIWELACMIRKAIGYEGEIVCDLTKPDGIMRRVPDSMRIRELGWEPKYDMESAVEFMCEYYLKLLEEGKIN